jgi:hypothetical protein
MATKLPKITAFVADAATRARLVKYQATSDCDDPSRYLDPFRKKNELLELVKELELAVRRIDESTPSTDPAAGIAAKISAVCARQDPEPEINKTRDQVYEEIVLALNENFTPSLAGKFLCLKEGAHDFTFIRVDKAEARVGIYKRLEMPVWGRGVKVKTQLNAGELPFPQFGRFSFSIQDLLLTGKDEHNKKWLYSVDPATIPPFFARLSAEMGDFTGFAPSKQPETEVGSANKDAVP